MVAEEFLVLLLVLEEVLEELEKQEWISVWILFELVGKTVY